MVKRIVRNSLLVLLATAFIVPIFAQIDGNQQSPAITVEERNKLINVPSDTNDQLSDKADISGTTFTGAIDAPSMTQNNNVVVDVSNSTFVNLPADTNAAINDLMPKTSSNINLSLNNPGTGNGIIELRNTSASIDQERYSLLATMAETFVLRSLTDAGVTVNNWTFSHSGDTDFPGILTLNGNQALDTTDITTDINALAGLLPDAPTVKTYVDSQIPSAFNGGTITNPLLIQTGVDNNSLLTLKRTTNTIDMGISWQNSGLAFIKAIYVDESDSEKLKFGSGANADPALLTTLLELDSNIVAIPNIGTAFHVNGDIFAFNDGDMAARDISSLRKFSGNDYRLNGSLTDPDWALYKATQGATNGPEGTQAASGVSFSGEAVRVRVANNTDQGFMVENGIGINLFEINGSTGNAITSNNLTVGNDLLMDTARITSAGQMSIGLDVAPNNTLDVYGALFVTGDTLIKSNLTLENLSQDNFTFERRTNGIGLRAEVNPADGDPIFTVESSGNSQRIRIEHNRYTSTSNFDMKVGVDNDGNGGNFVVHEGNWQEITQRSISYFSTFPTLNDTIISTWCGRDVYLVGVGAGTINFPQMNAAPSATQMQESCSFTLHNYNSGSDITLTVPAGYDFMIDNVENVSSANQTLFFGASINVNAVDLTGYPTVGNPAYMIKGI